MNKRRSSLATVVLAAVTVVLCSPVLPCEGPDAAAQRQVRAKHPYASDKPLSEPAVFGAGLISTGDYESHPAFTPDGKTLYFLRSTPNFSLWTILVSRFEGGRWRTPEVAPFSGQYSDADPFLTHDGARLYFISNRPAAGSTRDET